MLFAKPEFLSSPWTRQYLHSVSKDLKCFCSLQVAMIYFSYARNIREKLLYLSRGRTLMLGCWDLTSKTYICNRSQPQFVTAKYHSIWKVKVGLLMIRGRHSMKWAEATTVERSQGAYWQPEFAVTQGHNNWRVTAPRNWVPRRCYAAATLLLRCSRRLYM